MYIQGRELIHNHKIGNLFNHYLRHFSSTIPRDTLWTLLMSIVATVLTLNTLKLKKYACTLTLSLLYNTNLFVILVDYIWRMKFINYHKNNRMFNFLNHFLKSFFLNAVQKISISLPLTFYASLIWWLIFPLYKKVSEVMMMDVMTKSVLNKTKNVQAKGK